MMNLILSYNLPCNFLFLAQQLELNRQRCRFYPNDTFTCDQELLRNPAKWDKHKLRLDEMIEETRRRLKNLKVLFKSHH